MRYENILSKIHLHKIFYTTGDEYYNAACGGHVHIEYHNHSYPRTSLRHFVALFP